MPHSAASDLVLLCLPMSNKKDTTFIWVKTYFACWKIFHEFCHLLMFFSKLFFNSFRNTIRDSNSLDPDQAEHFVGPDLGPT